MLMLRDESTRIGDDRVPRIAIDPASHRPEQEHDERNEGHEAEGHQNPAPRWRQRPPVIGQPRDEGGGTDDEGECPPGKRMCEGHAGLLLLGQRFVVSGDHLPVGVWRAIAAAGVEPVLEATARCRCDH